MTKKLKILLTHSDPSLKSRESIDIWRVVRPFAELEKHVDWQIDHQDYLIDHKLIDKKTNKVKTTKLIEEIERIGQYDIVWTSYFPDATLFDAMIFAGMKFGTKFVLDVDDDFFNIPPENSVWKQKEAKKNIAETQYCIENAPFLVTSCQNLHDFYVKRRDENLKTYIWPNYIGGYKHKPFDNGDKVVIGYFGGVSHVKDVEVSGFVRALRALMKKYRHVHFGSVGIQKISGLPKDRYTAHPGLPGQDWIDSVWPNINCDIAVAPLQYSTFNTRKTNIKWLETAMIPAAFVGSSMYPYLGSVEDGKTGLLVREGMEFWYDALERLILDKELRQTLAHNAKLEVEKNWSIDTKWQDLKKIIEEIYESPAFD